MRAYQKCEMEVEVQFSKLMENAIDGSRGKTTS